MLSMIVSFFSNKLNIAFLVIIITLGVLYGIEKIRYSNIKVKLSNTVNEISAITTENNLLKSNISSLNKIIVGLRQQTEDCSENFEFYKRESTKLLNLCMNTKEVDVKKSTLKVVDEKSNEEYIKSINSILNVD